MTRVCGRGWDVAGAVLYIICVFEREVGWWRGLAFGASDCVAFAELVFGADCAVCGKLLCERMFYPDYAKRREEGTSSVWAVSVCRIFDGVRVARCDFEIIDNIKCIDKAKMVV